MSSLTGSVCLERRSLGAPQFSLQRPKIKSVTPLGLSYVIPVAQCVALLEGAEEEVFFKISHRGPRGVLGGENG